MMFNEFCEILENISKTKSRLEIRAKLKEMFSKLNPNEAMIVCYLLEGRLAPSYMNIETNISEKTILSILSTISGYDKNTLENEYKKYGDIGDLAYDLKIKLSKLSARKSYSLEEVYNILMKISKLQGEDSNKIKQDILINLFSDISNIERKYLSRILVGKIRIYIGTATILEGLADTFELDHEVVKNIYYLISDIGMTAFKIFNKDFSMKIIPFHPISPALAERATSAEEILSHISNPIIEYKYDGFRIQVHKFGQRVEIYSRKLENITSYLPEIVENLKQYKDDFIIEGEAVAFENGKPLPFQEIIKRKRKYDIKEFAEKIPITVYYFDILYLNEELYNKPLAERRRILDNLDLNKTRAIISSNIEEINEFYKKALEEGMEGIIAKKPDSPYTPGQRNHNWIKLKKSLDTIDCLVVGYFYGEGKLKGFPASLLLAVKNGDSYETIAKASSGLSEQELIELKNILQPVKLNVISNIEPDVWATGVVVEVAYDEITLSPVHTCNYRNGRGLALRFPRIVRIRTDRNIEDITTSKEVEALYNLQKLGKEKLLE